MPRIQDLLGFMAIFQPPLLDKLTQKRMDVYFMGKKEQHTNYSHTFWFKKYYYNWKENLKTGFTQKVNYMPFK